MARAFAKVMAADGGRTGPDAVLARSKSVSKRAADDAAGGAADEAAKKLRKEMRRRGHVVRGGGEEGRGGRRPGYGGGRGNTGRRDSLGFFSTSQLSPLRPCPAAAPTPITTRRRRHCPA
jgi:hypothetical protein